MPRTSHLIHTLSHVRKLFARGIVRKLFVCSVGARDTAIAMDVQTGMMHRRDGDGIRQGEWSLDIKMSSID